MGDIIRARAAHHDDHGRVIETGTADSNFIWDADHGFAVLRDNHGNAYIDGDLACHGKAPVNLTLEASVRLTDNLYKAEQIEDSLLLRWWHSSDELPMPLGQESSLQTLCTTIAQAGPKQREHYVVENVDRDCLYSPNLTACHAKPTQHAHQQRN